MTDRELLERAAKAAGIAGDWVEPVACCAGGLMLPDTLGEVWNPLERDRDAFRLLCLLSMRIREYRSFEYRAVQFTAADGSIHEVEIDVPPEHDTPCTTAATRRAIVRAAAAIAMQPTKLANSSGIGS